jgi:putative endonuclease
MKKSDLQQANDPSHISVGKIGESIAEKWLHEKGFLTVARNYRKKWGEIDLILEKNKVIHFVEVKSVSYETASFLKSSVTRGTHRPEDNVHRNKLQRLRRAIQTWVAEKRFTGNVQIDVVTVRMVPREKCAVVELIENIIIE